MKSLVNKQSASVTVQMYCETQGLYTTKFVDILNSFSLHQHVSSPTHVSNHILDLTISRACDVDLISEIELLYSTPSDHACVLYKLTMPQPTTSRMKIAYRKTKSIDIDCLYRDFSLACVNIITPQSDVNNVLARLNSILQNSLDIHAPLSSRVITCRPLNLLGTKVISEMPKDRNGELIEDTLNHDLLLT